MENKNKKSLRRKTCRQHDFVDVPMLGPGVGVAMLGVAPERFDFIAHRCIFR